jgi:hypothetical protein
MHEHLDYVETNVKELARLTKSPSNRNGNRHVSVMKAIS